MKPSSIITISVAAIALPGALLFFEASQIIALSAFAFCSYLIGVFFQEKWNPMRWEWETGD